MRGEKFVDENNHLVVNCLEFEPYKMGIPCVYGFTSINECID